MRVLFMLIFFILSTFLFSQNEKLRTETINVFKEYNALTPDFKKISEQPIYDDSLKSVIKTDRKIMEYQFSQKEKIIFKSHPKFVQDNSTSIKPRNILLELGSNNYTKSKFHYSNGLSLQHNSGILLNFKKHNHNIFSNEFLKRNGEKKYHGRIYTTRFLKGRTINASFQIENLNALYWGGLDSIQINKIHELKGGNLALDLNLDQFSSESLLKNAKLGINRFFLNSSRNDFLLENSLIFELEKALKTYNLVIENNYSSSEINLTQTINSINDLSQSFDIFINSKFSVSFQKENNYDFGFNLSYIERDKNNEQNLILFPKFHFSSDKSFQKFGLLINNEIDFNNILKIFGDHPQINPNFENSFTKNYYSKIYHLAKFGESITFYNRISYNFIRDYIVLDLQVYDLMGYSSARLIDLKGLNFESNLSWSLSSAELLFNLSLNSFKSKKYESKNFIPNKISTIFNANFLKDLSFMFEIYHVGPRDILDLDNNTNQLNHKTINAYTSSNIYLSYDYDEFTFSLSFINLANQSYNFHEGFYNDDGFKYRFGVYYNF